MLCKKWIGGNGLAGDAYGVDASFGYLLLDYPGYDACSGRPNPKSIRDSYQAAVPTLAHPNAVTLHEEVVQDHNFIVGNCSAKIAVTMSVQRRPL